MVPPTHSQSINSPLFDLCLGRPRCLRDAGAGTGGRVPPLELVVAAAVLQELGLAVEHGRVAHEVDGRRQVALTAARVLCHR